MIPVSISLRHWAPTFAMDAIERNLSYSSFGIRIGDFDDTSNDVIMTDADNDGIYEGEVYKIGEYYFRVYADNDTNNHWSKYYYYYDRTRNSYEENYVTLGYCKKLIVRLDTTKFTDEVYEDRQTHRNIVDDPDPGRTGQQRIGPPTAIELHAAADAAGDLHARGMAVEN